MDNEELKRKTKSFYEYVDIIKKEKVEKANKELEKELKILELSIQLDESIKARIKAELTKNDDIKDLAKEILQEVLNPKNPQKLSKKEKIAQRANEISDKKD